LPRRSRRGRTRGERETRVVGRRYATTVRSHLRGPGPKTVVRRIAAYLTRAEVTRRARVPEHARQQRYWGAAGPIRRRVVFEVQKKDWFRKFRVRDVVDGALSFPRGVVPQGYGPVQQAEYLVAVNKGLPEIIKMGLNAAAERVRSDEVLKVVPRRSGDLRESIRNSLRTHKRWPFTLSMGAPVPYATVVDAYDPRHVEVQHSAGWVQSGIHNTRRYYAGRGDPDAEHHFWGKLVERAWEICYEELVNAAARWRRPVSQETIDWVLDIDYRGKSPT